MQWQWPCTPWKSCINQLTTTRVPRRSIHVFRTLNFIIHIIFYSNLWLLYWLTSLDAAVGVRVSVALYPLFFQFCLFFRCGKIVFSEFRIEMVYVHNHRTDSWRAYNLYWICMICIVHWYRFSDPDRRKSYQLNRESMCVVVNSDFAIFFVWVCSSMKYSIIGVFDFQWIWSPLLCALWRVHYVHIGQWNILWFHYYFAGYSITQYANTW